MTTPTLWGYSFNGYLFGGDGQQVQVLDVDGLEDIPDLRTQDENLGYMDGMATGRDFVGGRTITFSLVIAPSPTQTSWDALRSLQAMLQPSREGLGLLQFQLPGRDVQRVLARVRRRATPINVPYSMGKIQVALQFFAPDPLIYDDEEKGGTILAGMAAVPSSYRLYPRIFNTTYPLQGGGVSGALDCFNAGNRTVWPLFTIAGAVTNPGIQNRTTGENLEFTVTMGAADVLQVDTAHHTVTLNGANARNLLTSKSRWFGLEPGVSTSITIYSANVSTAQGIISYRNGYL